MSYLKYSCGRVGEAGIAVSFLLVQRFLIIPVCQVVTELLSGHVWQCSSLCELCRLLMFMPLTSHQLREEKKMSGVSKCRKAKNQGPAETKANNFGSAWALQLANWAGVAFGEGSTCAFRFFFFFLLLLRHPCFNHWFIYIKYWNMETDTFTAKDSNATATLPSPLGTTKQGLETVSNCFSTLSRTQHSPLDA